MTSAWRTLEKRPRGRLLSDRVKPLRLLQARTRRSRRAAAPLLGYRERQLQRWWASYTADGLDALPQIKRYVLVPSILVKMLIEFEFEALIFKAFPLRPLHQEIFMRQWRPQSFCEYLVLFQCQEGFVKR